MPKQFVITGCGRSGTHYIAELLNRLGCECRHERYFPKVRSLPGLIYFNRHVSPPLSLFRPRWHSPPWGEIAWQAAPYLDQLPSDVEIFHQVRHPVDYVASRLRKGIPYMAFRRRHSGIHWPCKKRYEFERLPRQRQAETLFEFWLAWNRIVETNAPTASRYRIEDVDTSLIERILNQVDMPRPVNTIEEEINEVSKDLGTLGATRPILAEGGISDDLFERVRAQAREYGYEVEPDDICR